MTVQPAQRSGPEQAGKARRPAGRKTRNRVGQNISPRTYLLTAAGAFLAVLVLWWAITAANLVEPLFLPGPGDVVEQLGEHLSDGELLPDAGASVYRILTGYLLATIMAIPIGALIGTSRRAEAALEPMVDFVRYMPVVAFVPLTILWVGTGDAQKFLIIWMGTFFQQVLLIADAVRRTPRGLIDVGETLGLSRPQITWRIVLRYSLPGLWDALRVSLGWAWTWLVVAELVAATTGMGYRITVAQRYFATDTIIGYVLVLGFFGLISDQVTRALGRRFFRYQKGRS